jgi:hypothetical protein
MSCRIAVICGHGEAIALDNPGYSLFFSMLGDYHCQAEPLRDKLTSSALAEYQAALIGGARDKLAPDEVQTLRKWVAVGGCLLVLSTRDPSAPRWRGVIRPLRPSRANQGPVASDSSRLVDGLIFRRPRGTQITSVDHSSMTGWSGSFLYQSNCRLLLDQREGLVAHGLPCPGVEGVEPGFAVLHIRQGAGQVLVVGSGAVVNNTNLGNNPDCNNHDFLSWLLLRWLPGVVDGEVRARKKMPQRHRLLHGYPMRPLMWPLARISHRLHTGRFLDLKKPASHGKEKRLGCHAGVGSRFTSRDDRPVLVGVLPTHSATPRSKDVGFVPFPMNTTAPRKAAPWSGRSSGKSTGSFGKRPKRRISGRGGETDRSRHCTSVAGRQT